MPQPIRPRNALVEIAQPIGGVPDYAPATRTGSPKRRIMAEKVNHETHAILAASIFMVLGLVALAVIGG